MVKLDVFLNNNGEPSMGAHIILLVNPVYVEGMARDLIKNTANVYRVEHTDSDGQRVIRSIERGGKK